MYDQAKQGECSFWVESRLINSLLKPHPLVIIAAGRWDASSRVVIELQSDKLLLPNRIVSYDIVEGEP